MINPSVIEETINNEFRTGYIYLSMADENNEYSTLAKERIENGMKFFNFLNNPTAE